MKIKNLSLIGIALCILCTAGNSVFAQGTAFIYQGRLNDNGGPANGFHDFRFRLAAERARQ